ncbi:hypothetical protein FisN_29Lh033 [Fistulifera solaris]|uniref:Strictosidine synthase conserved region domain-containing protein n=1 Tax=Fistulifera solaris TaxID=1519565 RepID=A0A1Z5JLD0_FISSO|nr:hypothetical protein FisN_29Lh033 [Fistulifera solaris]|eukprot:GAX14827.1 hypothetical protein FisN_29Lh033 [Fistulifera solaris]
MTFRNRRGRAAVYAAKQEDAQLYEIVQRQQRRQKKVVSRPLLVCLLLLWFFRHKSVLLRSSTKTIFRAAEIDSSNQSLQQHSHKLFFQQPVFGPETVVIGKHQQILVLTEDGKLVELLVDDKNQKKKNKKNKEKIDSSSTSSNTTVDSRIVQELGIGRPLGGRYTSHEHTLYIADAVLGLTRLRHYDDNNKRKSRVELIANTVTVLTEKGIPYESPLRYVNAVAVGPQTGNIYFTDSTDIAPPRIRKNGKYVWDTMYASKLDLIRGQAVGRVCEYNPRTGQVRILADGIHFANGIAVDPVHEKWLVVAETFGTRLLHYSLSTTKTSSALLLKPSDYLEPQILVDAGDMTGYVDNVDCAVHKGTMYCYGAIVNAFSPIHRLLVKLPSILQQVARTLLWYLPHSLAPPVVPKYTGVVRVNMETRHIEYIQDPTASVVQMISGVTVHQNRLYLGSLTNDHIVVYDLEQEWRSEGE